MFATACGGSDPLPCGYREQNDATNSTMPEATNLELGVGTKVMCGTIEPVAFNGPPVTTLVDVDTYRVSTATDASLILQFLGDPDLSTLSDFSVVVRDTNVRPAIIATTTLHANLADHTAVLTQLPAGSYDVTVSATTATAIPAVLNYQIRFVEDKAERCVALTTPAKYVEANDGATNAGNNMLDADFSKDPAFTVTASADVPEPSGLKIAKDSKFRITGASATAAGAGEYLDADTYEFTTGDDTDELTIVLGWAGAADLDYAVIEAGTTTPAGLADIASPTSGERATFAVKPKTTYWLWVAGFKGNPAADYDMTICGGQLPD